MNLKYRAIFPVLLAFACCRQTSTGTPPAPSVPGVVLSNYHFNYESPQEPKVLLLRQQEKLDDVLNGVTTEKEIFEKLTLWTRRQFEPGFPYPYPLSNGLDILKAIRGGITKGFCGQYAYLLADALKSIGFYDVRYVEIVQDAQRSHFLVEVWSNRMARWMLLDPFYAALIEDASGVPQSAWQVHSVVIAKTSQQLHRRWLASEKEVPRNPDTEYFALYSRTAISLRNDLARMDHPWTIQERFRDFLQIATNASSLPNEYQNISDRREDFEAPRNICVARIDPKTKQGVRIHLSNEGTCAYFDYFEIKLDEGDWKRVPPDFLTNDPFNKIACRTTNKAGIHGPVSSF